MRQAIRVYAIVALVVLGALLAFWWALPNAATQQRTWVAVLYVVVAAQLWVLLVIPLGVLAASDAAHVGRRGWLVALIVLIVLAPIAARFDPLVTGIQRVLDPGCGDLCGLELGSQSHNLYLALWTVALIPVPLAALIYTLMPARDTSHIRLGATIGWRRLIVILAIIGAVMMGALGYLANSDFIFTHFSSGTPNHIVFVGYLSQLLDEIWFTLLDALPVAVACLALARVARAGQRAWLAGWCSIIVLALLAANLTALSGAALVAFGSVLARELMDYQPQLQVISAVVPVVVLLLALIYALTTLRPVRTQMAALAAG